MIPVIIENKFAQNCARYAEHLVFNTPNSDINLEMHPAGTISENTFSDPLVSLVGPSGF